MHLNHKTDAHTAKWAQRMHQIKRQNELLDTLCAAIVAMEDTCNAQATWRSGLVKQRKEVQESMQRLQRRKVQLIMERKQLIQLKSSPKINAIKHLKHLYYLLGYRMTDCQDFGNAGAKQVTLHFNEYCFIKFIQLDAGAHYDLLHIQPEHPNFARIKQFLRDTNDLPGFLANVRKYFDLFQNLNPNNQGN